MKWVKEYPEKNRCITVNLYHDGVFTVSPFEYAFGYEKQITDIHFEGTPLKFGIKIIKTDSDVDEFVSFGYRNKWQDNLYVEHSGYDALDIRDQEETMADDGNESSDAYFSSDEEDLSNVDFHREVDDNVIVQNVTTNDQFLNKLCLDSAHFLSVVDEPMFANDEKLVEDSENIDPKFNVKSGVTDVEAGRCAGYDSMKKKTELGENESLNVNKVNTRSRSKIDEGTSKSPKTLVKAITSGEGCSESPNLANSNTKDDRINQFVVLGSLVTYRWIAHHYDKQLIAYPFIPTLKMKTDIKEKFLINVSLGQCKRAKQRALFDYEGGLKEHYGRLWEYRQVILDLNPGSTCRLDDEETESGHYYFRRIYVCFKGVKEGWLVCCRKVIGLDGCFLKHTCRGELLVAMGRDENNQMYPIA
uniref:Calcium/proton exchanger n=1 Tax=Tanacetum cinerariifolium TaxID=118510 RepID=A0A699HMP8_TANCI|nr:calcium/proton exchanger [Tanacetum cinerariifolium]